MTVSASSDLGWLSGRGWLLTPHHWWRPRTCPIRIACGLVEECAPWRLGGRECRHRCEDRKCNDRLSHVLLLLKPDFHWDVACHGRYRRKVAPLRSGHASRVFVESRAGARHKATDRLAPIAPCRRCRHACASRPWSLSWCWAPPCRPMCRTRPFGANPQVWAREPRLSGSSRSAARGGHLRHRSNSDSYMWYSGPATERCWRILSDPLRTGLLRTMDLSGVYHSGSLRGWAWPTAS